MFNELHNFQYTGEQAAKNASADEMEVLNAGVEDAIYECYRGLKWLLAGFLSPNISGPLSIATAKGISLKAANQEPIQTPDDFGETLFAANGIHVFKYATTSKDTATLFYDLTANGYEIYVTLPGNTANAEDSVTPEQIAEELKTALPGWKFGAPLKVRYTSKSILGKRAAKGSEDADFAEYSYDEKFASVAKKFSVEFMFQVDSSSPKDSGQGGIAIRIRALALINMPIELAYYVTHVDSQKDFSKSLFFIWADNVWKTYTGQNKLNFPIRMMHPKKTLKVLADNSANRPGFRPRVNKLSLIHI